MTGFMGNKLLLSTKAIVLLVILLNYGTLANMDSFCLQTRYSSVTRKTCVKCRWFVIDFAQLHRSFLLVKKWLPVLCSLLSSVSRTQLFIIIILLLHRLNIWWYFYFLFFVLNGRFVLFFTCNVCTVCFANCFTDHAWEMELNAPSVPG